MIVKVYNSQNVNFLGSPGELVVVIVGEVKTACLSLNMAWRKSYCISSRDNGSASAR